MGGSPAFARAIERKYLDLGGTISYGFRADRVLVEESKAVGVAGEKGEVRGDIIISAADAHDTVERLLGGRYRSPGLDKAFSSFRRFPSLLFLGLGLTGDFSNYPPSYSFPLKSPLPHASAIPPTVTAVLKAGFPRYLLLERTYPELWTGFPTFIW